MDLKIKSPVTARWTTVEGWDKKTQKYVELNCERWIQENRIREAGQANGRQEFPPSDAVQPDEMYAKIINWVNQRGKRCHAEVSNYLVQQRYNLEQESKKGLAPIRHKVEGLKDQAIVELTSRGREDRTFLTQKERETRQAWAALEAFQKKSRLEGVAEYSGRDTWYWWLVGLIAIEAIANSMMLADLNEYGLLGALTVMLLIGAVNAGLLGCIVGDGWRQKNSVARIRGACGWIMVGLGALGMVFWNLLVGHFRDSMLSVATRASSEIDSLRELLEDDTVNRIINNPLGLEGMLSWVLALIGIACCVFAATKWLSRDDRYPGYGAVHRAATEHNEEYAGEIEHRRKNLEEIYSRYVEKIRDERTVVENKKSTHQLITDTAKQIVKQFAMQLSQYQNNLDFIIAAYRSENEKARSTESPEFFATKFRIDQEILVAPEWEEISAPEYDEDWEDFKQAGTCQRL